MINWKDIAERDIKDYRYQKSSIASLEKKIKDLNESMTALKGSATDKTHVSGGGSKYEDNLINCIVIKERLKFNLQVVTKSVAMIERGLESIPKAKRQVLEHFYVGGYKKIMSEYNVEKSEAYRMRNDALREFCIAMYGITEL